MPFGPAPNPSADRDASHREPPRLAVPTTRPVRRDPADPGHAEPGASPAHRHGGRLRALPPGAGGIVAGSPVDGASAALHAAAGADRVALLGADPQFGHGIPAEDVALATRVLVLPRMALQPGPWTPPPRDRWPAPTTGLLLLDGIAARHVQLAHRVATQLLGPGDILQPWSTGHEMLPCGVSWTIDTGASVAVLDGRFATAARRWPCLTTVVQERLGALGDRLATHLAICQLPRVELRVLALLWALAERFGRVTPDGVVLSLRLTHRLIGQLVGAQRPTVSLALSTLVAEGHIARRADGTLLLDERSRDVMATDDEDAGAVTESLRRPHAC